MSSKIDICNLALNHLSMRSITSLSEGTPTSNACNTFFDPCRDDVLSEAEWAFASVQQSLVLVSDTVTGWDYVYQYPVKAARVWNVYDESTTDEKGSQEFEVRFVPSTNSKVICSDLQYAIADITYKVEDTTIYDSKFVMALSYRLAAAMAHQLTGSAELGLQLMNVYTALVGEAKRVGNTEKIRKPKQVSSYQNSRG